jgi:hypothetical protein
MLNGLSKVPSARSTSILPFPGSREAPWFDEFKPYEFPRFISPVEDLFNFCRVDDNHKRIETAPKYVSIEVEEQWKALPKYDSGSWTEFKAEVIKSYPEIEARNQGTLRRVRELIHEHQGPSFEVGTRVPQFVRAF